LSKPTFNAPIQGVSYLTVQFSEHQMTKHGQRFTADVRRST